jgi:hypothetical protein
MPQDAMILIDKQPDDLADLQAPGSHPPRSLLPPLAKSIPERLKHRLQKLLPQ